ncbi:hypothetical protein [Microcella sp.]|uniref:hypothetical protein n=1 Tax=Microcella sp. TaxID=1913979 RepID=UPI00391DA26D
MDLLAEVSMSAAIGAATGLGASFTVWWYVTRYLVPKLAFSPGIRQAVVNRRLVNSVKVHNYGRRAIVDVTVQVELRFGPIPDNKARVKVVRLKTSPESILFLAPGNGRLIRLECREWSDLFRGRVPARVRRTLRASRTVSLSEMFSELGPTAKVRVVVTGYDEYTGARRTFVSPRYSGGDIDSRVFDTNSAEFA